MTYREKIESQARGSWQEGVVGDLLAGEAIDPVNALRGTAKDWSMRYRESLNSLIERVGRIPGIRMGWKPQGPRGGMRLVLDTLAPEELGIEIA